jgi:uncharacterized membrane protein
MLQSRRFPRCLMTPIPRVCFVSATLPIPPQVSKPPRASHRAAIFLALYLAIVAAAFASGRAWLDELAAVMVVSLLLWPGLRRRSVAAFMVWGIAVLGVVALAIAGRGEITLDFLPVIVNAALCTLFARTLAPGSEPLIARLIAVLESPERIALPRVAAYARGLTLAWALLLGAQALVLALMICCAVPDGLLASFGVTPPIALTGHAWRWYLHLGSYATVLAFLIAEYAYRRWHLRHISHVSLPVFVARLVRRWPVLARSVMNDVPMRNSA